MRCNVESGIKDRHIGWSGPNSGNLPDFLGIAFLYRDISAAFDLCIKCR
jgi:hypothetical protein